ncbi:MAG: replicative DNA helicase [Candidatus Obscuribacterales bacterium]|jgi:replicative DNA helicase|nr:replicative DNA helicase [Candidatus Obscuribacterales bacterium]
METEHLQDTTLERIPPQATEAEQAVLGALLVNPESISKVVDVLEPDYFYRKSHQVIYAAVLDLFDKNEPIDIVTVSQHLKDQGKLENVGGRQYLTDLAMSVATTANVEYYAKSVNEKALLRNLIKAGTEIVSTCYEEIEADIAVDKAERLVFGIAQRRNMQALVPIRDIVNESFARIEQRYEQRDALSGLSTGFYDLNEMTSGWQKSDLVIVAARPSMGKTAFTLNLAQHAALECNVPVAVFSLEMSKEQLVQRLLCSEARIDANKLRTGFLQTNDWTALSVAMGRLGEAPLYIDDSPAISVLDIRAKCRRLKAEMKDLGLIIIDYIQLMQGRKQSDNRVQEVSEISRGLKTLARELDVPVIALSQLSRAVEARQNKRPMLSDLRESGSIEQDADIVMFIYRDDYYNPESERRGEAEIIIAKQRNGPVGTVELLYQASITRFLNKAANVQYA